MTREEAIESLRNFADHAYPNEEFLMAINALEQEPKKGHWEWVQYDSNPNIGNWHCSECRAIIPFMPEETDDTPIYKWCPMCGRRMIQEAKEC